MNKLKKLIGIILCALLITGCELKYEGQVEITSDGKMDMSIVMAYDRELISTLIYMEENDDLLGSEDEDDMSDIPEASITKIRTYLEENKPEEQDGVEISRYERNGYYGYQMTYEINNIDDVSSKEKVDNSLFGDFNIQENTNNNNNEKKMMFQKEDDTYYANYKLNDTSDSSNGMSANLSRINLSLKYTVTLPTKPIEHNADTVSEDGKTLTWNISSLNEDRDSIKYSFKLKDVVVGAKTDGLNTEMIMLIAGIVIIVIIIVVVLILFARNNKKLDKSLEALDQTIPSATPKPNTPVVENTPVSNTNTEQTPIETVAVVETNQTSVIEQPASQTVAQPQPTMQIETVPVVENIPVTPTQTLEQNNTVVAETPIVENMQVENPQIGTTEQLQTTPNLEEMPIIIEPSVVPAVPGVQETPEPQSKAINTENISQPVTTNEETTREIELESVSSDSPVINSVPEVVAEQSVVETQQTIETTPVVESLVQELPVQEQVTPSIPESNIFDTPNDNIEGQPKEESIIPNTMETKIEAETVQPVITEINENQMVNVSPVVEQPIINETPVIEVPTVNEKAENTDTLTSEMPIEQVNTVSKNIVEEETPIITEQVISEPIVPVVNEEPKLEVLETSNQTLEEPDIPLPEPIIEPQIIEEAKLEETPVIEEPTGNRFIQTDFIENRTDESQNNNTNI